MGNLFSCLFGFFGFFFLIIVPCICTYLMCKWIMFQHAGNGRSFDWCIGPVITLHCLFGKKSGFYYLLSIVHSFLLWNEYACINCRNDPEKFQEDLMNIARTTLSSKILTQHKDYFATLAVNAVLRLKVSAPFHKSCHVVIFIAVQLHKLWYTHVNMCQKKLAKTQVQDSLHSTVNKDHLGYFCISCELIITTVCITGKWQPWCHSDHQEVGWKSAGLLPGRRWVI